jgi:hypothetical protein
MIHWNGLALSNFHDTRLIINFHVFSSTIKADRAHEIDRRYVHECVSKGVKLVRAFVKLIEYKVNSSD